MEGNIKGVNEIHDTTLEQFAAQIQQKNST
jgi:hypothetical protein